MAGRAVEPILGLWDQLATPAAASRDALDLSVVDSLPKAARRWLAHATAPGGLMARAVLVRMVGRIKVRRWLPFTAVQVLSAEGYVWVARAGRGLSITGFDCYHDGEGQMRWLLAGRVPLMHATGVDISRSSAARLAIEAVLWLPTAFSEAQ